MKNPNTRSLVLASFLAGFLALSLWPDKWLWIWAGTFPLPVPVWFSLSALSIKSYLAAASLASYFAL